MREYQGWYEIDIWCVSQCE